jgi:hypothetical protein
MVLMWVTSVVKHMMELATWQENAVVLLLASNPFAPKQCTSTVLHIH